MLTTVEYCAETDVQNRLTVNGVSFVGDRNNDGVVDASEWAAYIDTAIIYAGNIIDAALTEFIHPAQARGAANAWLLDRAVDLAAVRAVSQGGRDVPPQLLADCNFALAELERIRQGGRVPGLVYPVPPYGFGESARLPRACNPHDPSPGYPYRRSHLGYGPS